MIDHISYRCPKCGHETFYVTVQVTQGWKVDKYGSYLQTMTECEEVIHSVDTEDIWTCASCGFDAPGTKFIVMVEK